MREYFSMDVKILNLKKKMETSRENANLLHLPFREMKTYDHWYELDKKHYYFKQMYSLNDYINHFLVEEIVPYFGLTTPHFELARNDKKNYGIASANFREETKEYCYFFQYPILSVSLMSYLKKYCSSEEDAQKLQQQILGLLACQIYINLEDLHRFNILFEKHVASDSYSLAPIYDFDYCFFDDDLDLYFKNREEVFKPKLSYLVDSAMTTFSIPSSEFLAFLDTAPDFKNYLLKFLEIDMQSKLRKVQERGIDIPDQLKDWYCLFDENKKEFVRSLHL